MGTPLMTRAKQIVRLLFAPRVRNMGDVSRYMASNTVLCMVVVAIITLFEAHFTDKAYALTVFLGMLAVLAVAPALLWINSVTHLRNHRLMVRHRKAYRAARRSAREVLERNRELEIVREQLAQIASSDFLTGLSNRRRFDEVLRERFDAYADGGAPFALISLDLDRFKPVNDQFGHDAGDAVLRHVAVRLRKATRDTECEIGRLGGDEFSVIVFDGSDEAEVEALAAAIAKTLTEPHAYRGQVLEVGASIGVAIAEPRFKSGHDMLCAADYAVLQNKGARGADGGLHRAFGAAMRVMKLDRTA